MTVTDVLNNLNENGFFSYVLPFILIFAVVFAILEKTKLLANVIKVLPGDKSKKERDTHVYGDSRAVSAVIAAAIGLLSLQLDVVSIFFANIFPKFGVGLAVFLVLLIFIGFFYNGDTSSGAVKWIGWLVGVGVVVWAIANWDTWFSGYYGGFGYWIEDYFWALVILGGLVGVIALIHSSSKPEGQ